MRRTRIALTVLAAGAALVATAAASGAPAKTVLNGTVGPGFSISLRDAAGHKLTKLKPGTYVVRVVDKGSIHDFHLKGPGVDKVITSVGFTGTKSAIVTLKAGKYTYVCDPHASFMKGSFTVA
jgi:plastocyanin